MKRISSLLLAALFLALSCMGAGAEDAGFTYADTIAWDAQYDVVVIGFGGAGGVSAITAADAGAETLILEKAPKGDEGGNTRYAGQFVGTLPEEELEAATAYFQNLRNGYDTVSDEMIDVFLAKMTENYDWLVEMGMNPDSTNFRSSEHPEKANGFGVKAYLPEGKAFSDEFNGEYWNLVRRNVIKRSDKVDIWYASPAKHLIQDPVSKTIIGVQAERDGKTYNIRALNGVIMACGGFENNEEMIECYTQNSHLHAIGSQYNTGDGILMAIEVNAALWHMGAISGPFIGYVLEDSGRMPFETMDQNVTAGLSMIDVGPNARRFTDESQKTRHGHVSYNGEYFQQILFEEMYAIFDEDCRLAGPVYKGYSADNSEEIERGIIIKADTLKELAEKINLDPDALENTVAEYNQNCADGFDPYYGRPAEKLIPISEEGPYYAIKLDKGLINTQGGAKRNEACEILDIEGNVIPNLYGAGEFGSIFSDIYQGACNLAETIIDGRIAGANAAAPKAALPNLVQYEKVEQGEVGRMTFPEDADVEFEATEENTYIGTGIGVAEITVKVTVDGDTIKSVEILNQTETPGISDPAIETMPGRIAEAGNTDVDVVAGASKTSRGIIKAVQNALEQAK